MATKEPTQKAKLTMRAIENTLSTDVDKDYYLRPTITCARNCRSASAWMTWPKKWPR